ncbi:YcxB family protein [Xanthobacter sp. V3C-3]|uniref:YcxB family protein n=1 Tax=Xanthobacter lutulentifluminis TaxID=3119935 RepID=UPI00372BEC26
MSTTTVADGPFDLAYRLTRADIAAFLGRRMELRGAAKLALLAPLIGFGALLGYLEDTAAGQALGLGNQWIRLAVLFVAVAALYGFVTIFMSVVRTRTLRLATVPPGEIRVVASRAGVRVTHAGRTNSFGWDEILAVTLADAHVFLVTAPQEAIIVPLRAFADHEHMLRFFTFADAQVEADSARADARAQVVQRVGKP